MTTIRFFREGGAGDSGAGGTTLQNIIDIQQAGGAAPSPTLTEQQLAEQKLAAQTAQEALVKEATNDDGTLKPGYIKDATTGIVTKDETYVAPVEGLNDDGTLQEGYKKDEQGNVIKDPDYKPTELTDEQKIEQFFDTVKSITGNELVVEYPEGVDPLTPQGIAIRDNVLIEQAQIQFEEHLAATDPRGYAYLLHRKNGLPDEDFFGDNKGFILPAKADFEASADMHAAVLRHDLRSRGLDNDTVELLVKDAITKNQLKEKATTAYTNIEADQKKVLDNITKYNAEREMAQNNAISGMVKSLDETINSATKFVIPDADKPAFRKYVLDSLRYDAQSNTFSLVQKIEGESLAQTVEALFFQHKKGDLKALIERKAKTQTAQNIRLKTGVSNPVPGSGKSATQTAGGFIPLSQITVTK